MEYIENTPLLQHPLENLDLDKLMSEKLGDFGQYQKWVYFLVCLPAALTAGITLASVFTADIPLHRCQIPGCDSPIIPNYEDAYFFGFGNYSIPTSSGGLALDSCLRFQNADNSSCESKEFSNLTEKCEEHVFSRKEMRNTLASEFDLVCGEEWKLPLSQSVFFAGVLVGAALFGHLGDVWGRKNMFLLGLLEMSVCGIAAAFSTNFLMFTILQFFTAMGQVGVFQTVFVLGIEIVGKSKRVFCGIVIEYFFVLGEILLALAAWYFKDWRKIQFVCVIPGILFFSYYFLLPQSIRWLILKGKFSKAREELNKIAKGNKVVLPSDQELQLFKKIENDAVPTSNNETLLDLLKNPKLLCRLLNVFLNWTVITMIYYGLSMNAASLAGDIFVNFALLSLTEIPGYTLSYLGMTYLGRRVTLASSLFIGGVSCLISSLLPASYTTGHTVFFILGKFGATAGFGTTYLYTSELFPTRVRNACVGLSSMMGRVGAIVSPYVARLGLLTGIEWLPMAVFAAAALVSGSLTLLLPETKGKALPRTMMEAEKLGETSTRAGGYQEIGSQEE
eukprot:TRINITY_DN11616_c0_g1_i1.p1 TRINITY_DN11616_c0_g1~~TRINITY_DN11616_c0_g1_i1.p1  ORF type:complete len:562 (-),score=152.76 TRINITY_DN11616_c0_g1_i1:66-1751(-)